MNAICVCSGKGSPGATFVAINLAAAIARAGEKTWLLDLDPAGGDVIAYLGLDPRRGVYPLLEMDNGISDADALLREAQERDGLYAIGGFPSASAVDADSLRRVLDAASATGMAAVADLGRVTDQHSVVAARSARALIVVRPDLVSVLGAERALKTLADGGVPEDRLAAVVSGHERRRPGDVAEIERALGIPVVGIVPLERRDARKALIAQTPIVRGPLARAFQHLALAIRPKEMPQVALSQAAEATV